MARDELDLDLGWSITESAFSAICDLLSPKAPTCILEFGSGVSSVRLAQRFPEAEIVAIEHDPEHLARTRALADRHLARVNLTLNVRPLTWQFHLGAWFRSYRQGAFPTRIDAVIIDGPPYHCFKGREACLHQVAGNLPVGGVVILDDYSRRAERAANLNWDLTYPGHFRTLEVQVGHGLCVKERVRLGRRRIDPRVVLENHRALGLHLMRWMTRRDTHR